MEQPQSPSIGTDIGGLGVPLAFQFGNQTRHSRSRTVRSTGRRTTKTGRLAPAAVALCVCMLAATLAVRIADAQGTAPEARPIEVLFLGHAGTHHHSAAFMPLLAGPLAQQGIQITYVEDPEAALDPEKLAHYDALLLYANHETITPEQERSLLDFVAGGKGFIPIHSASFCFRNSDAFVELVGAQFESHGTGTFSAEIVNPGHPAVEGVEAFETWDETYVHTRHNDDRTVLMERVDADGSEPYTWVRTHGDGRVFYTAYGHDERTWSNPGFQQLIERGILWAVGEDVRAAWQQFDPPTLSYHEARLPNYERRDPPPRMQEPLSPEESQKLIQVPGEFRLELFAAEPDIINPLTMAFDERGRLWVIETLDYPNQVRDAAAGEDRIKILEDTDGDGRADEVTVFADSLNIPTSLVFVNDGVLVAQAPNFLFLRDTDGDDRADTREVLFAGWGTYDTHAGPSNLQYGPDNFVWGTVGYSGFEGSIDGQAFEFRQAAFRFRPDGSDFEVMTSTTNNTWGLGFSETFDVFGSTANNDPSWHMAIPNRYFADVEGLPARSGYQSLATFYYMHPLTPNIRQVDVFGGYTAAAGHYLYTARAFPREYWNRIAFINEPTGHLIGKGILEKEGAGFATNDGWSLLASADEWVSPVHAQVGPDGAVWVADWYGFITQHNPTPEGFETGEGNAYVTDLRDRSHGRIYRIVYDEVRDQPSRSLSKDDPDALLEAIQSDNMLWRLTAQRVLVERGEPDVVSQLLALVRDTSVDELGTNGGAFHALWTLEGLGVLDDVSSEAHAAAAEALQHPASGVRKAAAQALPPTEETGEALLDAGLLQDADLHTRLAAVLALADVPASDAVGRAVYEAGLDRDNYADAWLSRGLYVAAVRHRSGFLAAYEADSDALPAEAVPARLRLGDERPDWRLPGSEELAQWQEMEVPGSWEEQGLEDFDGVVWFTRRVTWEGTAPDSLHLGPVEDREEVWVNGVSFEDRSSSGAYAVPEDALRTGENVLTVRITNFRNEGGFVGEPQQIYLGSGELRTPLAGVWNYRVERQTNAAALYRNEGELAAHVAWFYGAEGGAPGEADGTDEDGTTEAVGDGQSDVPAVVRTLGVIEGQLKFDLEEITVPAGGTVEIVFENTDQMQHNVIIGRQGTLQEIGEAADELATSPDGPSMQYVPDIPEVLFATNLVNPGQVVRFRFQAPDEPGSYPYVCTFPGHWRVMNGVLQVTPAPSDG